MYDVLSEGRDFGLKEERTGSIASLALNLVEGSERNSLRDAIPLFVPSLGRGKAMLQVVANSFPLQRKIKPMKVGRGSATPSPSIAFIPLLLKA
jgi:hypothetical protein